MWVAEIVEKLCGNWKNIQMRTALSLKRGIYFCELIKVDWIFSVMFRGIN
jgi:hypothetical protein